MKTFPLFLVAVAVTVWAGCGPPNAFVAPPPPSVTVQNPVQRDVTVYMESAGQTAAVKTVNIRARVRGYLRAVDFDDGQHVKEGDRLFQIEPESYEAAVKAAEGTLAKAHAAEQLAQVSYERFKEAFATKAVSEIDMLTAEADLNAAKAEVLSAEANLANAQLDLSYTELTAPVDGVVSRRLVNVGNLVGGTDSTLLTSITVLNPMHVYFNASERDILPFLMKGGKNPSRPEIPLALELADGSRYAHAGSIDYGDPRVDPATGTLVMRGVFPNDDLQLLPGLFAKILIPRPQPQSMLVPDLAVQRDMRGTFLLVVDGEGTVEPKYVTTGARVGDERIIESGLEIRDQVIVNGIQRARPGIQVTVEQAGAAETPDTDQQTEPAPREG